MESVIQPHSVFLLIASPFVGSFLGLVIDRLPRGETVVAGRSRCEACGTNLAPRDLVPLLSWLAASGRCRHCGARLRRFYPAIELAAVGVALWSVAVMPGWLVLATAALGWALLVLAVIDWRHMILPDAITLPLVPAGLLVAAASPAMDIGTHLAGAAIGGASLAAVALVFERLAGREGLGFGDVKLFAAAGAWLGWAPLPSVLLIGAGTGLAAAILRGASGARAPIAFGPWLALGFWLTWLYGPLQPALP